MNQVPLSRRVWIKKPNGVPTTLHVGPDDLIDDLKGLVMQKYPTSLAREYDPSDLIVKLDIASNKSSSPSNANSIMKKQPKLHPFNPTIHEQGQKPQPNLPVSPIPVSSTKSPLLSQSSTFQRPSSRNDDDTRKSQSPFSGYSTILRPDQVVWRVLDQHFPNGMTMNDAFLIEVPHVSSLQGQHRAQQGSTYSSVFNSYASPQKDGITPHEIQRLSTSHSQAQMNQQQHQHQPQNAHQANPTQQPKYAHSMSFSGEVRQPPNKRNTPVHRRSQSNPQSPSSASFSNVNNTTILMLPKDYNGGSKERPHSYDPQEMKQKSLDKITEIKQEDQVGQLNSTVSPTPPSATTNLKKIKTTTEKVFPSINVLIVEDNKINQKILQAFLRKRKINFQTAVNGEEAIQKWKQGGFHLVLMDIQLPVKSGIEAAIEIRRLEKLNKIGLFSSVSSSSSSTNIAKLSPHDELELSLFRSPVIIVALTASTSSLDRQKALAAGCNDYLTKPVNLDWLQNKITEWGCMQALIDFDHWKN